MRYPVVYVETERQYCTNKQAVQAGHVCVCESAARAHLLVNACACFNNNTKRMPSGATVGGHGQRLLLCKCPHALLWVLQ